MNLQQMRYFLTVAETGNITAAANLLHMAQPPLSRQIKQLEEELDTELFDRSGRHLQLTESGILLAHRAREILNLTERSLQEVRSVGQGISGTLYMGAVSTANYMLLPNLIKEFNKLYPQVRFQLVTEATTRITELLEKGVLELGIVRMPFNSNFLTAIICRKKSWSPSSITKAIRCRRKKTLCPSANWQPTLYCYIRNTKAWLPTFSASTAAAQDISAAATILSRCWAGRRQAWGQPSYRSRQQYAKPAPDWLPTK